VNIIHHHPNMARETADYTRIERAAYAAGYQSHDRGHHSDCCPFEPAAVLLREAWLKGWHRSQDDAQPAGPMERD